jgi:CheY-like chemotaxis protein
MMPMPRKLLLADDSVTIQRVIELTFADEDVQVIAVGNGKDAIDRIQRDPPDIVLADAGMPERNGYEVAAFIKGQPAYAHIPVVLLTGAFEPVDEARAKSVGCDGILVKPFEPQIVIGRVRDLLAGRQPSGMWASPSVSQPTPPRQPAPALPVADPARGRPAASGDSLEAYFDHLDAAFSSAGGPEAPPSFAPGSGERRDVVPLARRPDPASHDPLAGWDPDLHGDPARPAATEPPIVFPQRAATADPKPASPGPVAMPPAQTPPLSPSPAPQAPGALPVAAVPPAPTVAPMPVPAVAPTPSAAVTQTLPPPPALPPSLVEAFAALLAAEQRIGLTPSAATVPGSSAAAPQGPPSDELVEAVSRRVLARFSEQSRPEVLEVAERLVREEIERIKQSGQL